ncbi:hypothetical protein QZM91_29650 [Burkholderia multivorans]|jgi:hypothetical protein|uniref:hypothetical protein n=1 Tax=Pseudomonadota TaxID=1224 RepID=UPI000D009DAF|nr:MULTISPECIES: hypothetical protein [Pseudomonadota]MCA7959050.1 hypothetical protein [Burkholderia multivorans]MDN7971705.1 hypothetical protein [Burkholderia multivorans]MDN8003136.1 hypothetical protein [Burkholderia multivorans]PRG07157.1 hypothetical protein C6Q21_15035 [Burkholderia multivorans]PRH00203.1 hypothetical protein C6T60_25050 [Burkholderia multivorans]
MRYFVSYAAHRHGGGGFFGNVIVNSRMMDRWTVAALADAQRIAPGHVLRVVILSYHPLGTMRATDVIGYWLAAKIEKAFRRLFRTDRPVWIAQSKEIARIGG